MVWQSTPVPTFSECSPLRRCGTPQANSTTSIPRCTDPIASGKVFPCSSVTSRASVCWSCCSSWRKRCMTRARRSAGASRHPGYAACAAFTAASMSAALQNGTRLTTLPVAGLVTSPDRPESDATGLPPIQSGTVSAASTGLFMTDLLLFGPGARVLARARPPRIRSPRRAGSTRCLAFEGPLRGRSAPPEEEPHRREGSHCARVPPSAPDPTGSR